MREQIDNNYIILKNIPSMRAQSNRPFIDLLKLNPN